MADAAPSVCCNTETSSSALCLPTLVFQSINENLWIPLFPLAKGELIWWMSGHNILRGSRVTPKDSDTQLFTDALSIDWGAHWDTLTGSDVWSQQEKTLHINVLELKAIQQAMLHWLRQLRASQSLLHPTTQL